MRIYKVINQTDELVGIFADEHKANIFAASRHYKCVEEAETDDDNVKNIDEPISYIYVFGYSAKTVYFKYSYMCFGNNTYNHNENEIIIMLDEENFSKAKDLAEKERKYRFNTQKEEVL